MRVGGFDPDTFQAHSVTFAKRKNDEFLVRGERIFVGAAIRTRFF